MTKKWFSMFALLVMLVMVLAITADASKRPYDPRIERANIFNKPEVALDDGSGWTDGRYENTASLGSAQPAVDSRGMLIAQTYRDWLENACIGRVVDNNPPGTIAGVQFVYISLANAVTTTQNKWGYNAYQAVTGSIIVPGGQVIVQDAGSSTEAGSYPKIQVNSQGYAIIGSYDFPLGSTGPTQFHVVWDDGIFARNFGDINGMNGASLANSSIMNNAVRKQGDIVGGATETIWPKMAVTENGGQTVIYLFGYERDANSPEVAAVKVFRKVGLVKSTDDASWTLVFTDNSFFPTVSGCASKTGTKVAVTWLKHITGEANSANVYAAISPTGLSGTWVTTNVSGYTKGSAGYRAWLEADCAMDTSDKLHVIWNAYVTDGTTGWTRSCRLFHWSEWNPTNRYTVYTADWDITDPIYKCGPGSNVLNLGKFSIGECDGRLYTIFSSFNDLKATGHTDDCCKSYNVANGELFVSVSKDLQGKSWDKPRNLSSSYSPQCDTGNSPPCADDRWAGLSRYGMDDADFAGTEIWPVAATYDLGTGYSGTKYIQIEYTTDRMPGGAVLATPQGIRTLNDQRWIRLACVTPITAPLLACTPKNIAWPTYGRPGVQKNVPLSLENVGNATLTFSAIELHEDSSKGWTGPFVPWLGFTGATAGTVINETAVQASTVQLNKSGVQAAPNHVVQLWGHITFKYPALVPESLVFPIEYTVADTVKFTKWDSISTACLKLIVSTNGNMGHDGNNGYGGLNMNFTPKTIECDTGSGGANPGTGNVYLYDGSPVILKKSGADIIASWAVFSDGFETEFGFKPLVDTNKSNADGQCVGTNFGGFASGIFVNADTTLKIKKTWYAPKALADSCRFILQRLQIWPYNIGTPVSGLAIGEAIDWDVPSDSSGSYDLGGSDGTRNMLYMKGYNKPGDTFPSCIDNNLRYAGMALLYQHFKNRTLDSTLYGYYIGRNDSEVYPEGTFVPDRIWTLMNNEGYSDESGATYTDLHGVLVYKNGASDAGFTMPANDTLTIWTALATIYGKGGTTSGNLDSLKFQMDRAKKFFRQNRTALENAACGSCCSQPTRGNVNQAGIIDVSDLSLLVSYLTSSPAPTLPCQSAANVNGAGIIDVSDLSLLVSYLTASPPPVLPPCG